MSMKRITVVLIVAVLGINLAIAAKIYSEASAKQDKDNPYAEMELMTQVMELVRKEYVDGNAVSYQDLTYGALKGMVNSLDPHSQFMEPKAYEDMKEDTEGKFGGIGIVISMSKEGFLTVVAPMEDTPGAKAGLLPGDRIIKINGKVTEKMGLQRRGAAIAWRSRHEGHDYHVPLQGQGSRRQSEGLHHRTRRDQGG